jgi:hypothetical protein
VNFGDAAQDFLPEIKDIRDERFMDAPFHGSP